MLLAGIALTALASSSVGLFTYVADDATLRTLTFWNLGSLNGASYQRLWPLLLVAAGVALWLPRRAKALNALLLGESEASHLGIDVEKLKRELVFCTALGVGAAVAAAGMIGFVGLVVPHLVRLLAGPDHRVLLPASVLAGASLLLFADLVARLALAPAELPIGIVTAFIGAPFFFTCCCEGAPDAACGRPAHPSWSQNRVGGCHPRPVTGPSSVCSVPMARQKHIARGLSGELLANQGKVWLDQQELKDWGGSQRAQRLAVLPQTSTLDFAFRVEEVVGMGRLPHQTGRVRDDEIIDAALQAADVGHLSGRSYLALSGGERQRVHLARVLAQLWPGEAGQTLLLDEPTSMLDPCINTRRCRPFVPLPSAVRRCW
jgi:energy-coupling factor transporter ATP-binding protein EcfA2